MEESVPHRRQRKCVSRRGKIARRKRSSSAPAVLHTPEKKKRKLWSDHQMKAAMRAVEEGLSTINKAALDHDVPKTTLKDRLSGRVVHGVKPGPRPYLERSEETELASFIEHCASLGYGKSRKDIMCIAQSTAESKGLLRKKVISPGWWRRFMERQNKLVLRKGDSTAFIRMDAVNEETLNDYFDLLEDTLKQNGLQNLPSQIYNVDETGVPLDPKAPKIVVRKGTKKARYQSPGRKGQITVVACGNAAGNMLPPLIIFDTKKIQHAWTKDEVPGSKYGTSEKGWITTELFESWFTELFLPNAVASRPLLLLLDGHSTHYQPDVINLALENEVLILCLPPHTTHATQPLDCGVFSPLKAHWSTVCHDFTQRNPGKVITRFSFNKLFSQAWLKSVNPSNLIAGFKVCGVYPVNRQAVKPNDCTKNTESSEQECSNGSESNKSNETESAEHEESASPEHQDVGPTECIIEEDDEITPELEKKFEMRFEEGYDLCLDPIYTNWLKKNHPDLVTSSEPVSIVDKFSHIQPLSPLNVFESTDEMVEASSTDLGEKVSDTTEQSEIAKNIPTEVVNVNCRETRNDVIISQGDEDVYKDNSVLSKMLVDHTPQVTPISLSKRPKPKARLLTSADCLKMLQEKEDKKKQRLEEKERKQKEREEKKKFREEEAKKKKEEKERRAQERAEKANQKSKVSGQSKNSRNHNEVRNKRKEAVTAKVAVETSSSLTGNTLGTVNNSTEVTVEASSTSTSTGNTLGTENNRIDTNICCMCFETYENDVLECNGADWIDCACGRWLHLECADDCVVDRFGKDRYCPYCIDGLCNI